MVTLFPESPDWLRKKLGTTFVVVVCITLIKGRTQQNYLRIYPNAPFIIMDCLYSYYCQKHSQQNVAIPDTGCSSICSTAGLSVKMSQAYKGL